MPEELGESVTTTEASVTLDPALLNKPQRPEAAADPGDELLRQKLGLANQHTKQSKKEAAEARQQLEELKVELQQLKDAQQSAVRQNLEDQGAFRELYEQEKARAKQLESRLLNETTELKQQLESVTQGAKQERLKASAMAQISRSNAVNPQQLYQLLSTALRTDDEGNPTMLSEGVEQPLSDYLLNLKQSPDWAHHFSASGAKGIGVQQGAPSVAPGRSNPYRTGNLTEILQLEVENAELAKALKAEAKRG